jgi:hypothetical protein
MVETRYKVGFRDLIKTVCVLWSTERSCLTLSPWIERVPLLNRLCARIFRQWPCPRRIGEVPGLYLRILEHSAEITRTFCSSRSVYERHLTRLYSQWYRTAKFQNFLILSFAQEIMACCNHLVLFEINEGKELTLIRGGLEDYVYQSLHRAGVVTFGIRYDGEGRAWLRPLACYLAYLASLAKQLITRGCVVGPSARRFKIAKEIADGIYPEWRFLSDDYFVGPGMFAPCDILFYNQRFPRLHDRFPAVADKGYYTVDLGRVPFVLCHLRRYIREFCVLPLVALITALRYNEAFLLEKFLRFHIVALPYGLLVHRFGIRSHITINDTGDVQAAETIMLNSCGVTNALYHWSDLNLYHSILHEYDTVNLYFIWGKASLFLFGRNFQVDEIVTTGFHGRAMFATLQPKQIKQRLARIKPFQGGKVVAFYNTSFNPDFLFTAGHLKSFLHCIKGFAEAFPDVTVLFKVKSIEDLLKGPGDVCNDLRLLEEKPNIIIVDMKDADPLEVIAVSDLNIGMGMNSVVTLALLLGREGLYYNMSEAREHPFYEKYYGTIVFAEELELLGAVKKVLCGSYSAQGIIESADVRWYDAFGDGEELSRLCARLAMECEESGRLSAPKEWAAVDNNRAVASRATHVS